MKLEESTWPEAEKYLKHKNGIIIPVGTCEQHGRHLPLNTDTLVAERIAEFLSEKTGIIVAPSINYGVNLPCDRNYPGTCSLGEPILKEFLSSILDWWKLQGFKKFYILSAHGDPFHIKALKESDPENARVLELYDFEMKNILEKQKGVEHACEGETSLMLFLYPEKVKKDKIEDRELPADVMKGYLEHKNTEPFKIHDSPGCQGYPSAATAKKGKLIFNLMKENALKWIEEK